MKKFIFGFLLLTLSCQTTTPTPTPDSAFIASPLGTQTPLPSPLPVPATEVFVLTPTSSSTPEPPPLYFTDEFTSTSAYWTFLQTGGLNFPTTTFENDSLQINSSSPDTWMIAIHTANTYNNVFIQAKVSTSPTGSVGLICSYDESTGWFEYNVASDGTYSVLLGQWLTEGIAKYIPLVSDFNNQVSASNSNYQIGLDCRDNFLSIYINETIIRRIDVTNYGITEGAIGITASSFLETPSTATFEWVKISQE